MKTASAKAKGRKLQHWVRDCILRTFPQLTKDDVRSTSMGAGGEDIQLSAAGRLWFPYHVECKAQEKYKGVYDIIDQADEHGSHIALGIIKMNRRDPLVVLRAEHFFELLRLQK